MLHIPTTINNIYYILHPTTFNGLILLLLLLAIVDTPTANYNSRSYYTLKIVTAPKVL